MVSHVRPQPLQLVTVFVLVSQPSMSGAVLTQSAYPELQLVYVHDPLAQAAPSLWSVSHASPHALQLVTVSTEVSQPSMSGAVVVQSAQPAAQPEYLHVVPLHEAPVLCAVSQASPHALQFEVVSIGVSHPSESGAVVVQSAQPAVQPEYWHVLPLHEAPELCVASHVTPHALQFVIAATFVSQPSVSGAVVTQSAQPAVQPV